MSSIDDLYKLIDEGREGKNIGLSTGLPRLDNWIGGIQKKTYYLLFGGSGSGKTSLALYSFIYRPLMDHKDDPNFLILYMSLELGQTALLAKLLSLYLWETYHVVIPFKKLMSWQEPLDDWSYSYVKKAKTWLESINDKFVIYDKTLNRDSFYHTVMQLYNERGTWKESEDGRRKIYTPNNPNLLILTVIDHIGLVQPKPGATKKEEMDAISSYAVTIREKCGASFLILQQENRNSANMDRRKMDMTECSPEDLEGTSATYHDCEVCIGVYYPLKHKLKTCHDYPIILNEDIDGWTGLRDRYRGINVIKCRNGDSDVYNSVNFFGEIGLFQEMPKAKEITDWRPYLSLTQSGNSNEETAPRQEATPQKSDDFYEFNFE